MRSDVDTATAGKLTDITGREYGVGDYVVYPQGMGGHRVQMVLAQVVKFTEKGYVQVRRVEGSRGSVGWERSRFLDTETGKYVNPWSSENYWDTMASSIFEHRITNIEITDKEYQQLPYEQKQQYNYKRHRRGVMKSTIKEEKQELSLVTIQVVGNIVAVDYTEGVE